MERFVTKDDLKQAFDLFEARIKEQHETRIQMISGHYSDVLKSNQELRRDVCASNKVITEKLDGLITQIQPILDAQKLVVTIHSFLKWLGLPFTFVFMLIYWIWKNV